jgi:hypothetical protein
MAGWLLGLLVLSCTASHAHPLAPRLLEIIELGSGDLEVRWKEPRIAPVGLRLVPSLPDGCELRTPAKIAPAGSGLLYTWSMSCRETGLVGRRIAVDGLAGSKANVLLRIRFEDGRQVQELLSGDHPEILVPDRTPPLDVALRFVGLGVSHLSSGLDHMLFILCLMLLVTGKRSLVFTITAFTGGHAMTLSLATLGWIEAPADWVELLIAFSIVMLAAELAAGRAGAPEGARRSLLRRRPWTMAFGFGLLHGLGFASALAEIGVPGSEIALALFSFNVGIELGQLVLVGALASVAALGSVLVSRSRSLASTEALRARFGTSGWPRYGVAYAIGTLAAYWCIGRVLMLA